MSSSLNPPPEIAASSSLRDHCSTSSRRRLASQSLLIGDVEAAPCLPSGAFATGIDLLVNGIESTASLTAEGLRWISTDVSSTSASLGGSGLLESFSPAGVFSYCIPLLYPDAGAPHVIPFSEMLCAQRLEPLSTAPHSSFLFSNAGSSCNNLKRRLFGVAIDSFRRSPGKPSHWKPWKITLESSNEEIIEELLSSIITCITAASSTRPRRLLVILNPNSGSGAARTHYRTVVQPIFSKANIAVKLIETEHPGHAVEIVQQELAAAGTPSSAAATFNRLTTNTKNAGTPNINTNTNANNTGTSTLTASSSARSSYDGIVAVGGDGIFHEILNGVMSIRAEADDSTRHALMQLRLAHIPCGSTDAVACSLNGCRSVFTAAMHTALGDCTALDALRISIGSTVRYACCIATYGFMGDVVQESEKHRWLGPLRYDIIGAVKLFNNQSYKCRVSYLPPDEEEESSTSSGTVCLADCPVCRSASASRSQLDLPSLDLSTKTATTATSSQSPPTVAPYPDPNQNRNRHSGEWKVLEGEWMSIMLIAQPCRSDKTPYGMVRFGHLSDGGFKLVLVRRCSPLRYLQFLTTMSSSGLSPGQMPGVLEVLDAVACRVESLGEARDVTSHWNVDGEIVDGVHMEAHAHLAAVQCFARGVER